MGDTKYYTEHLYGNQYWRTFRNSYRKLTWVGFELATTEFHSANLYDWTIRSWVQFWLRASLVQIPQFYFLFSVQISFQPLPSSVTMFILVKTCTGNHTGVTECTDTYGIHHWRIFRSRYRKFTKVLPQKDKHGWGKLVYVRDGTVSERLGTSMGKHLKCI